MHMLFLIHAKVRAGHYLSNIHEVEACQPDRYRFLSALLIEEHLIEWVPLLIYLDPLIKAYVRQYLILGHQAALVVVKFAARPRT